MDLTLLAISCAEELRLHRLKQPTESSCCLALLRRATVEQVDQAWSVLQQLFAETVHFWMCNHPSRNLALLSDSAENYVAQTFSRFWSTMRERRLEFQSLPAALSYLHAILNSILIDTLRRNMHAKLLPLPDSGFSEQWVGTVEDTYHDGETWTIIQSLLTNEDERRVIYLLYYCGFKPREMVMRFPTTFRDVQEIYRLNHTIIDRLRRNRERLRWLLSDEEWLS